jgi:hypothetical protein
VQGPTAAPSSSSSSSRLPSAAIRPRALRRQHSSRLRCTAVAAEQKTEAPGLNLLKWLKENGAPQDKVELKTMQVPEAGALGLCTARLVRLGWGEGLCVWVMVGRQQGPGVMDGG